MAEEHLDFAPHFSRNELEASDTASRMRIKNVCPDHLLPNLMKTSWVLEAARKIVGPLRVTSAYRSPGLNAAVGSKAVSAHLVALAADVVPLDVDLQQAWDALIADPEWMYQVDQLIYECRGNLHIGMSLGYKPPRMELRKEKTMDKGVRVYPLIGHWSPQGVLYC